MGRNGLLQSVTNGSGNVTCAEQAYYACIEIACKKTRCHTGLMILVSSYHNI